MYCASFEVARGDFASCTQCRTSTVLNKSTFDGEQADLLSRIDLQDSCAAPAAPAAEFVAVYCNVNVSKVSERGACYTPN